MARGFAVDYSKPLPERNKNGRYNIYDVLAYFNDKYALSAIEVDDTCYEDVIDKISWLLGETCILSDKDETLAGKVLRWWDEH